MNRSKSIFAAFAKRFRDQKKGLGNVTDLLTRKDLWESLQKERGSLPAAKAACCIWNMTVNVTILGPGICSGEYLHSMLVCSCP